MGSHRNGRPSAKALLEKQRAFIPLILDRLGCGDTLLAICRNLAGRGGPAPQTVRMWYIRDDPPGFAAEYARAREAQCEAWADEIVERSRNVTLGVREETNGKGEVVKVIKGDTVDRDRLAVDSMKWVMSKFAPRRYGDFMEMPAPPPNGPIVITIDPFRNHRQVMADREASLALPEANGQNGSNGHNGNGAHPEGSNGKPAPVV